LLRAADKLWRKVVLNSVGQNVLKGTTMTKLACTLLLALFTFSLTAQAQFAKRNVEFNGGWAHVTGDQGMDGFNAGAALYFTPRVSIAADYDGVYDTSTIGPFSISQLGPVVVKSHLQNFLFGPRVFFPGLIKSKTNAQIRHLRPFAEAQFGISHLNSSVAEPQQSLHQSTSDNAFTWMLGGGVDYRLSAHWSARGKLDLERTHFSDEGQSRLRLALGLTYAFGSR
jgi:hypothetical protein